MQAQTGYVHVERSGEVDINIGGTQRIGIRGQEAGSHPSDLGV